MGMNSRMPAPWRIPWALPGSARRRFKTGTFEEGFTLLEVITAIFIFFCGIVGILSLFTTALMLHKTSLDRTVSSLALEQIAAEVGSLLEDGAVKKSAADGIAPIKARPLDGYPGYFYSAEFEEGDDGSGGGLLTARIRITWKARGVERGETFEFVFRPGAGQRNEVQRMRLESGK